MITIAGVRRVATYERVSSEDQRERETIRTQTDELARSLARDPNVRLIERFVDDGVSGSIPLAERPGGGRLMRAAAAGQFDEIHCYKFDRLGRDAVDLLVVRRRFMELGIRVISVVEGEPDLLGYDVQAVVADHGRREFLRRSADGVNRAAREGRYCGGMVSFGYRVEGRKPNARIVPDETLHWADQSAADIVRRMYGWVGLEGWSSQRVADELNRLGVMPQYAHDGRGVRGQKTSGMWEAGRVRNLLVLPTYRGELTFGKRTKKKDRPIISAPVEPLVSVELWEAAQATLARNRICAKNTRRVYLLRTVVRCGTCGLTYLGSQGRADTAWYRCGGQLKARGPIKGGCPSRSLRADTLEPMVWQDIERFLRHPGDVLTELDESAEHLAQAAVAEAEIITLRQARDELDAQQQRAVHLVVKGIIAEEKLAPELDRIAAERAEIERRLAALQSRATAEPSVSTDLLDELRKRLEAGLTPEQRQEIVRLLVSDIIVRTTVNADGTKDATVTISYRFPRAVVSTRTGRGSLPRRSWASGCPWRRRELRTAWADPDTVVEWWRTLGSLDSQGLHGVRMTLLEVFA